ncbi:MAG: PhoU domain-containing protein [Thermoprotei archaeon]
MHTRKLQQIGGGTLYLSLPKDLVKRWNLKKGDVIKIEETVDGNIILYVKEEGVEIEESYGVINLTSFDMRSLQRKILGMYLLGYTTIVIKSFNEINSDVRDFIRKTCRDFIGLEIMEETINSIVLQSVINISTLHPYKLLQRANLIANSIYKDALNSIISGNVTIERSIARRDEDVNRLYFLIVRVLRTAARNNKILRKFEISDIDLMDLRLASSFIENIGDIGVEIALLLSNTKMLNYKNDISKLIKFSEIFSKKQDEAVSALVNKKSELAENVVNELKLVIKDLESTIKSIKNQSIVRIALNLRRIGLSIIDIADLVL